MANTGYKGYTTLEQYYTDNSSNTGTTKANTVGDGDYVAPVSDTGTCPPVTYYSTTYSEYATRDNCGSGYDGTQVILTATTGQFTSYTSQVDADAQAVTWVQANKQSNANSSGSCIANTSCTITLTNYVDADYPSPDDSVEVIVSGYNTPVSLSLNSSTVSTSVVVSPTYDIVIQIIVHGNFIGMRGLLINGNYNGGMYAGTTFYSYFAGSITNIDITVGGV